MACSTWRTPQNVPWNGVSVGWNSHWARDRVFGRRHVHHDCDHLKTREMPVGPDPTNALTDPFVREGDHRNPTGRLWMLWFCPLVHFGIPRMLHVRQTHWFPNVRSRWPRPLCGRWPSPIGPCRRSLVEPWRPANVCGIWLPRRSEAPWLRANALLTCAPGGFSCATS